MKQEIALQDKNGNVEILTTSWERVIGDTVNNKKVVAIFNSASEKSAFITAHNEVVRRINAAYRREQRAQDNAAWARIFAGNEVLQTLLQDLAEAIKLEKNHK